MATDVRVYNTGGSFISDLGTTVLPAAIKPFDFSALDELIKAENDVSEQTLKNIMGNVKEMGRIQDELTQVTTPSVYHSGQIDLAKQAYGLDENMFAQAVNNIDNPMAMFAADRKMKKYLTDPRVKDAMYDSAFVDAFKNHLPSITDPELRIIAIKDLDEATQSDKADAIKNLNLDQYRSIDLEELYTKALDQFAPRLPTVENVTDAYGRPQVKTTMARDQDMVAKTRYYFQKEKVVQNNLMAKGYIDAETGKPTAQQGGGTWFDDMEASELVPIVDISHVGSAPAKDKTGKDGLVANYRAGSYTSNVTAEGVDLGVTASVETGILGPEPANSVHGDPAKGAGINIGRYSFNTEKGRGKEYLEYLEDKLAPDCTADSEYCELVTNLKEAVNKGKSVNDVKAAYKALQDKMGGPAGLAKAEDEFAIKEIALPAIGYVAKVLGKDGESYELSPGEKTFIFDAAIQHGDWEEAIGIDDYAKDGGNLTLIDFMAKRRTEYVEDLIREGTLVVDNPDSLYTRIEDVRQKTRGLDAPQEETTVEQVDPGVTAGFMNLAQPK